MDITPTRLSTLINEALISQIKASDTWNEYQASRLKDHTYTIALNGLIDANAADREMMSEFATAPDEKKDEKANAAGGPRLTGADSPVSAWAIATDEQGVIARHTVRLLGL